MSTPTPHYDAWQTAFYWSWLSNDASQHDVLVPLDHSQKWPQCLEKAREQATRIFTERLTDKVRQALQQGQELIGDDWHAVWGPVVYVKGARPLVTPPQVAKGTDQPRAVFGNPSIHSTTSGRAWSQ